VKADRLVFHPDAADEYLEAARWYRERSLTVHDSFVAEVERALRLIVAFPNRWPRLGSRHRRVLVRRFPYSVVYLEKNERLWGTRAGRLFKRNLNAKCYRDRRAQDKRRSRGR
jgi:toxin ParE1/3/4